MLQILLSLLKISRPLNLLIVFLSVLVAGFICSGESQLSHNIFLAAISAVLIAASGYIINDIFDINIDKINRPERPLASGKLSMRFAAVFYVLTSFTGLLISIQINIINSIIAFSAIILLSLYSFKLKRISLAGNVLVAVLAGMVFVFAGAAVDNISAAVLPALFAFLINLIREVLKDMEDLEGDLSNNIKTFPYRTGFSFTKIFLLSLTLILILFTFFPFIYKIYKIEYFILVMVAVNPMLVYFSVSIFRDDSKPNLNKLSFLLKLDMIFGLTAIYFGK